MLAAVAAITLLAGKITARPEIPIGQYLPPDQVYGQPPRPGIPDLNGPITAPTNFRANQYLPPNQQYGPPNAGDATGGGYGNSPNSPAKYDFEYMILDLPSGNDFGQRENREGDMTRGMYYILLPDGRRQRVDYEADQDGYRPKISYLQESSGTGTGSGTVYPDNIGGGYPVSGGSYPGAIEGYNY